MGAPPKNKRDDPEQPAVDRSYYYDDAHGYEDFDPEIADEEDDEENCDD